MSCEKRKNKLLANIRIRDTSFLEGGADVTEGIIHGAGGHKWASSLN